MLSLDTPLGLPIRALDLRIAPLQPCPDDEDAASLFDVLRSSESNQPPADALMLDSHLTLLSHASAQKPVRVPAIFNIRFPNLCDRRALQLQ